MILRKTYKVRSWLNWDHEFNGAVQDFKLHHLATPNILLASEVTFSRIDMVADRSHITNIEGRAPESGEHCPLHSMSASSYELSFFLDETLADGCFSLIHDPEPGGEEPVPQDDSELVAELLRASA